MISLGKSGNIKETLKKVPESILKLVPGAISERTFKRIPRIISSNFLGIPGAISLESQTELWEVAVNDLLKFLEGSRKSSKKNSGRACWRNLRRNAEKESQKRTSNES